MTTRKNFNSKQISPLSDAFPQAVITDNLVFISGMPGIDPATGQIISDDFETQLRQSFSNIEIILRELGGTLSNIVKTTVFMVARNDFSLVNKVYRECFLENAPARSTPQVMPFPAGILVSVECIARL